MSKPPLAQNSAERLTAAQAEKTELETQLLRRQLSPDQTRLERWKALAAASGIAVALVSVVGAVGSVGGWLINQAQEREARVEERLDNALSRLTSDRNAERASGVASLKSLLLTGNSARSSTIFAALADQLAQEDDPLIRASIVSTFINLEPGDTAGMKRAAEALASANRRLWTGTRAAAQKSSSDAGASSYAAARDKLSDLAQALDKLVQQGAPIDDLSDLYLGSLDLSAPINSLERRTLKFDRSFLRGASFEGAKLDGASFVDTDLMNVNFSHASLMRADFSETKSFTDAYPVLYISELYANGVFENVQFPDFTCANLAGANFKNHIVYYATENGLKNGMTSFGVRFTGANLERADFRESRVLYQSSSPGWDFELLPIIGGAAEACGQVWCIIGVLSTEQRSPWQRQGNTGVHSLKRYSEAREMVVAGWAGTNWRRALLPPGPRALLERVSGRQGRSSAPGLDAKCTGAKPNTVI